MKVILRDDVEKLGKLGEVVNVKDGYARNYLLPRQLAYMATAESEKMIEADRKRRAVKEQRKLEDLKKLADQLNGRPVNISVKANEEKILYGSVGPAEIAAAVKTDLKVDISPSVVQVPEPFKTLGTFDVTLHLAAGAEAVIKVWVVAEAD